MNRSAVSPGCGPRAVARGRSALRRFLRLGVLLLGVSANAAVTSDPAVVAWGPNRLDVFAVGFEDHHLWHTSFNGVGWQSAWDDRGAPESGWPGLVSVVSWGPGRIDVFLGGGTYQNVWHTAWNGSMWQPWDNRGHPPSGAPLSLAAISWGPNRLDVFTVDAKSGHLWQLTWNGASWVPWSDRGAPGSQALTGPISAVSWGPNRIDVFAVTPQPMPQPPAVFAFTAPVGGTVWHTAWNGSTWQGWDSRGAPPEGALGRPVAVSWDVGRLDLFTFSVQNPNRSRWSWASDCWHTAWNGAVWQPWDDRGSPLNPFGDQLNAIAWGPNRLDVFATAISDDEAAQHIFHNSWNGQSWQAAWDDRGAPPDYPPNAGSADRVWLASWGPQRLDVFTVGNEGHLWQLTWNGSTWLPWRDLGAPPGSTLF